MSARVVMVMGTTSSAGKSLLVTALCRIYARRGIRVAPFKAQNLSNNAAVCADGSEIGRAQAVQAAAAGIEPTAEMNPILLKPEAGARAQIVVLGRAIKTEPVRAYWGPKGELWSTVTASLDHLRQQVELVVIEGAGSPVELNLTSRDMANMRVARYARSPVLLVGDIDRGGVFAQLLGTLWLLEAGEREWVKGLIVNKFRGDMALFSDGVRILQERGGVPVLGVVPYLRDLSLPDEDAVALDEPLFTRARTRARAGEIDIAVIQLPHIANFDDFNPLAAEPGVQVRYVSSVQALGRPDAILLPGTKSTIADLDWLRAQGLAGEIVRLARDGVPVAGICGGYQMLGRAIRDPEHVESSCDEVAGLGLLPVETTFAGVKATHRATAHVGAVPGWMSGLRGQTVQGYEIHMGRTDGARPWLEIVRRGGQEVSVPDGATSPGGRVWGCYLHGLFDNANLRRAWLSSLGWRETSASRASSTAGYGAAFDRLADAVEEALDMALLDRIVWG
jgi:adenosylcobyric acid synthase